METKLCRICAKSTDNHLNIFKTEGLKTKLETCLPIVVSQHCLLPETICRECVESVNSFYGFIKNCLENLIILEQQYNVHESCLKSKRRFERGTVMDHMTKTEIGIQTDELSFVETHKETVALIRTLEEAERTLSDHDYLKPTPEVKLSEVNLVPYDLSDDSNSAHEDTPMNRVVNNFDNFRVNKQYFDNQENRLINEIALRINQKKRKCDEILPYQTKICKFDVTNNNRRKNRQPKRITSGKSIEDVSIFNKWNQDVAVNAESNSVTTSGDLVLSNGREEPMEHTNLIQNLPQVCLLCESHFPSPALLATHVYDTHGIDMAQILASQPILEKKKKLPNLVKIADLRTKPETASEPTTMTADMLEGPPTLQASYACSVCPALLTNKTDLYTHLRAKHPEQASLTCGLCVQICTSPVSLSTHLETCVKQYPSTTSAKYICKLCRYSDDNLKTVENHVIVHEFLLQYCRKQSKIFDPSDYVETNANSDGVLKVYTCGECDGTFEDFKEFSAHRRSQHQIFHCDLCNKSYGRNSHLWKHVNRLHKGHPSITCQLCHKTSASKYHLAQHFSKIHSAKLLNSKPETGNEDFMKQKFQGFDFQSVKQSFMRQELLQQESQKDSYSEDVSEQEEDGEKVDDEKKNVQKLKNVNLPKEIDSSSNLYTNIITNYTPPQNNGEFKCPKCLKGFHKKNLLKKHKKNCRPRLQKDLLTRCKTCSRIFKDRQSLTKHLINYHSEYACEICGQKFQSKCEIVSHIRFTHPACHLMCTCGNILRNQEDLMAHKQDHCNSFICQFCADSLPTKIKLKMHILSLHRKILSLSCGICLKLFETQHILRDHVRLVHKEHLLPLTSCTVCGKNYGSKWKTFDHLNKSHGRIFKPCKVCLEVFDSEDQLQRHYDTAHAKLSQSKVSLGQSLSLHESSPAVKKEMSESDFEGHYENEDKNSNSDPEDGENYGGYQNNSQSDGDDRPPATKMDFATTPEISLLEKRLLGKKGNGDEQKKSGQKGKHDKKVTKTESPVFVSSKRDLEDMDCNQSPLQNSSKRTVYVNSNDPSLCEICLKTWPAKKHLWQHYIRCHKTVAATVCGICLKANESYETLQKHLRENHPTLLHGQGFGSNFICRICGRYHNASSKLKLHMAIHENFDWKILEPFETSKSEEDSNMALIKREEGDHSIDNGYEDDDKEDREGDDDEEEEDEEEDDDEEEEDDSKSQQQQEAINYESLIEEVECSSGESGNEDGEDAANGESGGGKDTTSSEASEDSEEEEDEEASEENSLESQMLQNMLMEKNILQKQAKHPSKQPHKTDSLSIPYQRDHQTNETSEEEESNNSTSTERENFPQIKSENCSSDDEEEVGSAQISIASEEDDDEDEMDESEEDSDESGANEEYERKPEELDSAVQSISYESIDIKEEQITVPFCELQSVQSLNAREIQSAVDSIL